MTNFDQALDVFIRKLQDKIDRHYNKNYPGLQPETLVAEYGTKFVKIVSVGNIDRRVHSFVVRKGGTTKSLGTLKEGDVLLAASWKQPAKHVRGTIFTDSFEEYGVSIYGANYLR